MSAVDEEEDRRARFRASPEGARDRRASREAYRALDGDEALSSAQDGHGKVVSAPAWDPLSSDGPTERVLGFLNDRSARVELDSGQLAIATSPVPLRDRDGAGDLARVDLGLVERGGSFEPRNALVETVFPGDLGDGLRVGDLRVDVAGAASSRGRQVHGKLFYPNVDTDTDALLKPLPAGAEIYAQLRSPASPEDFRLRFDLPADTTLRPSANYQGAFDIVRDGKVVGAVSKPATFDAQQAEVPTSARVVGGDLIVHVEHRDRDVAYPLMLDPQVLQMQHYLWSDGTNRDFALWGKYQSCCSSLWHQSYANPRTGIRGLSTWNDSTNFGVTAFHIAEWNWYGTWDRTSYPVGVQEDSSFQVSTSGNACRYSGIYSGDRGWVAGGASSCVARPAGSETLWWVGPKDANGNYINVGSAYPVFGTQIRKAAPGAFTNFLNGMNVWVTDDGTPAITQTSFPTGWIELGSFPVVAKDWGVGVKTFRLDQTGVSIDPSCRIDSSSNRCQTSETLALDAGRLPEGANPVTGYVTDALGGTAGDGHTVQNNNIGKIRIDRSPPDLSTKSGELYTRRFLDGRSHSMTVTARDGQPSPASSERSGVKSLKFFVDRAAHQPEPDQQCPQGSCPKTRTFTLDASDVTVSEGRHTLQLTAADQLDHESSEQWDAIVDRTPPTLELSGSLKEADNLVLLAGAYDLSVHATDGDAEKSPRSGGGAGARRGSTW